MLQVYQVALNRCLQVCKISANIQHFINYSIDEANDELPFIFRMVQNPTNDKYYKSRLEILFSPMAMGQNLQDGTKSATNVPTWPLLQQ